MIRVDPTPALGLALIASLLTGCAGDRATDSDAQPGPAPNSTRGAPDPGAERASPAPARVGFDRFRMAGNEAGCPPEAKGDCVSAIELRSDGALELDPWGAPGAGSLAARLDSDELERISPTLTATELLTQLDSTPACPDANRTESMLVSIGGGVHENATGHCNEPAVQAVRKVMIELAGKYFPDHHLISPPF